MIQFSHVGKRFRRHQVLNDINLTINRGERVALVGSNGAGKTTLIRALLGEYVCDGKVTVSGLSPRQNRREVLSRIGFVPQLPPPLKMPVGQLIHFAASLCAADPAHIESTVSALGLDTDRVRRQPFVKLSGGQKQKLLIAIALGRDCDVLVMDEPAANLDPEARRVLFQLLAKKSAATAMIISSHRLDEVASLVNRVVEMDCGKVVLDDHVEDSVDMMSFLRCELKLVRAEVAFANAIDEWGFVTIDQGLSWRGEVSGSDRLRFMGLLSRYAGLLKGISMEDAKH
ncbi:MAG: ABC transporter ATP-binding protein [Gammaproteobacteria bacterium]|nr:ABC transporter ATP-binding protein [Gammaproteobacteria bacterium]